MPVYVDDMEAPFGRMLMCHMAADSTEELLVMADRINVARKWIQYPGTNKEHFDICKSKRKLAISYGAVEVSMTELCSRPWSRRDDESTKTDSMAKGTTPSEG